MEKQALLQTAFLRVVIYRTVECFPKKGTYVDMLVVKLNNIKMIFNNVVK
jgi:hypothetical protein